MSGGVKGFVQEASDSSDATKVLLVCDLRQVDRLLYADRLTDLGKEPDGDEARDGWGAVGPDDQGQRCAACP
jgi:hypothetical protein